MSQLPTLPQSLVELSTILKKPYLVDNWVSSVNMLLVADRIAFIKRSNEMPSHKGQIGFFGGYKKEGEDEPYKTAFREFNEETGIPWEKLKFHGYIEPVSTRKNQFIIPCLCEYQGELSEFLDSAKSNGEWSQIVLVELEKLKNSENWQVAQIIHKETYTMYFNAIDNLEPIYFNPQDKTSNILWGASAKMVVNFFKNYP